MVCTSLGSLLRPLFSFLWSILLIHRVDQSIRIFQVVQELDQEHHDSASFSRLFTDHEGSELQFSQSVFEMMNQGPNSIVKNLPEF